MVEELKLAVPLKGSKMNVMNVLSSNLSGSLGPIQALTCFRSPLKRFSIFPDVMGFHNGMQPHDALYLSWYTYLLLNIKLLLVYSTYLGRNKGKIILPEGKPQSKCIVMGLHRQ